MSKHPWSIRSWEAAFSSQTEAGFQAGHTELGWKHPLNKNRLESRHFFCLVKRYLLWQEKSPAHHDTHDSWRMQMSFEANGLYSCKDMSQVGIWTCRGYKATYLSTIPVLLIVSPLYYKYHQILLRSKTCVLNGLRVCCQNHMYQLAWHGGRYKPSHSG